MLFKKRPYYLKFDNGTYATENGSRIEFKSLLALLAYAGRYNLREYTWVEVNWYE